MAKDERGERPDPDTGPTLRAVDAPRLARPFLAVLVAMVAVALLLGLLAASGAIGAVPLGAAFAVAASALVVWLGIRLRAAVRDEGVPVDPARAVLDVAVQDLSDWGILAVGVGGALLVWARWDPLAGGGEAGPVAVALFAGLLAVVAVALVRLPGVRLLVLEDAVVRAPRGELPEGRPGAVPGAAARRDRGSQAASAPRPPGTLARLAAALRSGPAARYPLADLAAVEAGGPLLRLRTASPLADWTCVTGRAGEIAETVRRLQEDGRPGEGRADGADPDEET